MIVYIARNKWDGTISKVFETEELAKEFCKLVGDHYMDKWEVLNRLPFIVNDYNWNNCPIASVTPEDVAFVNDYIGHELFDSYEELEAAVIDALCK